MAEMGDLLSQMQACKVCAGPLRQVKLVYWRSHLQSLTGDLQIRRQYIDEASMSSSEDDDVSEEDASTRNSPVDKAMSAAGQFFGEEIYSA